LVRPVVPLVVGEFVVIADRPRGAGESENHKSIFEYSRGDHNSPWRVMFVIWNEEKYETNEKLRNKRKAQTFSFVS
jgi:hypothetical protein